MDDTQRSKEADAVLEPELEPEYPSGLKFGLMVFSLCLGGFLVSLDTTVVAAAVPVITDEFHSLEDIGWYSSVYFLAMCMPQLPLVKANSRYPIRWTYSIAMCFFMAGSAVCGSATSSSALIVGRALAGLGSSGILVGTNGLVPFLAPVSKRPIYFGLFIGAMLLGVGSGPLIGGVLTQEVTWRWNFYMNLPIGAFILVVFIIFVHPPSPIGPRASSVPWPTFSRTLDLPGAIILTAMILCLQLALQWGGVKYQWNNGRIISLLTISGVLFLAFLLNEKWQGDNAMLPGRILGQRNVICAILYCFCNMGSQTVLTYYLPIWFQGVQGATPILSGVHTLPMVITTVITTIGGGALMTAWDHVGPYMVIGSIFGSIGAGLLTTFEVDVTPGKWIGYQILYAVGSAAGRICPSICLQNILEPKDVSYGYTLVTFVSFVGGAIFVSIAQALFSNFFINGLEELGLPESDISAALTGGVKTITSGLSDDTKMDVLNTLNASIVDAWRLPLVLCCLGMIGAVAIDHNKIRGNSSPIKVQVPSSLSLSQSTAGTGESERKAADVSV